LVWKLQSSREFADQEQKDGSAMQKTYRFCFFAGDGNRCPPQAAAVLVLHFDTDATAAAEAVSLLSASALWRIEVWQGTRCICRYHRPVQSLACAANARAM